MIIEIDNKEYNILQDSLSYYQENNKEQKEDIKRLKYKLGVKLLQEIKKKEAIKELGEKK